MYKNIQNQVTAKTHMNELSSIIISYFLIEKFLIHIRIVKAMKKIKGKTKRFATPHSLNILLVQGVNYDLLKN